MHHWILSEDTDEKILIQKMTAALTRHSLLLTTRSEAQAALRCKYNRATENFFYVIETVALI